MGRSEDHAPDTTRRHHSIGCPVRQQSRCILDVRARDHPQVAAVATGNRRFEFPTSPTFVTFGRGSDAIREFSHTEGTKVSNEKRHALLSGSRLGIEHLYNKRKQKEPSDSLFSEFRETRRGSGGRIGTLPAFRVYIFGASVFIQSPPPDW